MLSDWKNFLESMRKRYRGGPFSLPQNPAFAEYLELLPRPDRIPLLLAAYKTYRELGPAPKEFCPEHYFESSMHSLLISRILSLDLDASEDEACAVLRNSFHYCGHGGDVVPPIRLAERVFAGKPYTVPLFDAAQAYRKALQGLISVQSQLAKQELDWILWHDARHPEKRCFTRQIQLSFTGMGQSEAFAWQWMLRHTTHALNHARGKAWLAEGERRLSRLGAKQFQIRIEQWLVFTGTGTVFLSPAGSNMLRLLVIYGAFVPTSLPFFEPLKNVRWANRETARKVTASLNRVQPMEVLLDPQS